MSPTVVPDDVAEALAHAAHRMGRFGAATLWYDTIRSTNDRALELAERGAAEGCLVLADAQTAGRGRQGRSWESPGGAGIYASVVLRPPPHAVGLLTLAAGVALADGILAATGLETRVKWPNDVCIDARTPGGRKVAGVLAEAGAAVTDAMHVVLGFGINVLPAAYPPAVAARATSLEAELGRPVGRGLVLAECLAALWFRYQALVDRRGAEILSAWRHRAAATFGRIVEWDGPAGPLTGVAQDVDDSGALLVDAGGRLVRVTAGEVRWRS